MDRKKMETSKNIKENMLLTIPSLLFLYLAAAGLGVL
jgi:hypothetical protein